MNKKLKYTIIGFVLSIGLFAGVVSAETVTPNFWKRAGNAVNFLNSSWELGSSSSRIAKGWFTNLDVTNLTVSGFTGMTQGSVLFAGSGGALSQDNANLFFDDTNNRLGIGTATPITTIDILGASLTGSSAVGAVNIAQTWNTSGSPTAIKLNVTNTASGASSNLIDLQVGGSSKFKIDKDGVVTSTNTINTVDINLSGGQRAISSGSGYILLTTNYTGTFTGLRFGGTTSANPMFKRNGTILEAKLADDSNYTSFYAGTILSTGSMAVGSGIVNFFGSADGVLRLTNAATTDFNRLQFGGTTSSFPALKRSGADIQVRLADDSGFANIRAARFDEGTGYTSTLYQNKLQLYDGNILTGYSGGAGFSIDTGLVTGSATNTRSASAVLQADSTTKGFLPPRMTTTQKNAITSPTEGLIVYDTTLHKLCVYTGSAWETITSL